MNKRRKKCSHGPWVRIRVVGQYTEGHGWKCRKCGAVKMGGFPDAVEAMLAGVPHDREVEP